MSSGNQIKVEIPTIKSVQTKVKDFENNMYIASGILKSIIDNNMDGWNDAAAEKFERIITDCTNGLDSIVKGCKDTNTELDAVIKEIEAYVLAAQAFNNFNI